MYILNIICCLCMCVIACVRRRTCVIACVRRRTCVCLWGKGKDERFVNINPTNIFISIIKLAVCISQK